MKQLLLGVGGAVLCSFLLWLSTEHTHSTCRIPVSTQQPQSVPYTVVKKHVQEDRREGSGQYLPLDCLFTSLRASRREGSEPFTHVYTMSMGSSGQRLRGGQGNTDTLCVHNVNGQLRAEAEGGTGEHRHIM